MPVIAKYWCQGTMGFRRLISEQTHLSMAAAPLGKFHVRTNPTIASLPDILSGAGPLNANTSANTSARSETMRQFRCVNILSWGTKRRSLYLMDFSVLILHPTIQELSVFFKAVPVRSYEQIYVDGLCISNSRNTNLVNSILAYSISHGANSQNY